MSPATLISRTGSGLFKLPAFYKGTFRSRFLPQCKRSPAAPPGDAVTGGCKGRPSGVACGFRDDFAQFSRQPPARALRAGSLYSWMMPLGCHSPNRPARNDPGSPYAAHLIYVTIVIPVLPVLAEGIIWHWVVVAQNAGWAHRPI